MERLHASVCVFVFIEGASEWGRSTLQAVWMNGIYVLTAAFARHTALLCYTVPAHSIVADDSSAIAHRDPSFHFHFTFDHSIVKSSFLSLFDSVFIFCFLLRWCVSYTIAVQLCSISTEQSFGLIWIGVTTINDCGNLSEGLPVANSGAFAGIWCMRTNTVAFTRIKVNFERKKETYSNNWRTSSSVPEFMYWKKNLRKKQKEKIERKVKTDVWNGC